MRAGSRLRRGLAPVLLAMLLGVAMTWSMAVVATGIHVVSVRSDLADLAQEIAHHSAHTDGDEASGRRYLAQRLGHLGRSLHVRSSAIRTIRRGSTAVVEVRITAVVGFALGGHPQVGISVARSAPVEAGSDLP